MNDQPHLEKVNETEKVNPVEAKDPIYGVTCCPSCYTCMLKYPECGRYSGWLCGMCVPMAIVVTGAGFVASSLAACGISGCCKCFFCCLDKTVCCETAL